MTGSTAVFVVTVTNMGVMNSGEYTVQLIADYVENNQQKTEMLLYDQGIDLTPIGGSDSYYAQLRISPFILGEVKLTAAVVITGDNDNTNNEAEAVMTASSVILPGTEMEMSAPYGLVATEVNDGVRLQWGFVEPSLDYITEYNESMSFPFYGINVYMDGRLLTTLRDLTNETTISDLEAGEHTFHITLLYGVEDNLMESPLSNSATIVTDIATLQLDGATNGDIVVFNADGVRVAVGMDALARLPKGVYIIQDKHNGTTTRVVKK